MDKNDYGKLIESLLNEYKDNNFLDSSLIPKIDLYMDQVTTFMDKNLDLFKRNEDDKTLTKTMINNYSKSRLLPPSEKKKYTNDHILLLLLIFYLKPTLSITDIGTILSPIQDILLENSSKTSLKDFYDIIANAQLENFDDFSEQIVNTVELSKKLFSNDMTNDNNTLSIIATIFLLSMQAALQKKLALSLIDTYLDQDKISEKKEEAVNKKNKSKKQNKLER